MNGFNDNELHQRCAIIYLSNLSELEIVLAYTLPSIDKILMDGEMLNWQSIL